mmetsp:Transcript_1095/g.1875  ORF Transcript_1095/g.1875 Transcript_1095/m.1875 type:complete len:307 (+) Transcript_1095:80-1000(+)|eukprot:CAMPEP_0201678258 /NCGR_PEP_ID=MMETSP0494-20130426/45902_1 /ASSEMBLY_ACC=CAM_ASM_000839 /TAXON_ID=420259 /ORGANISM="Thalassiosira gravida, Strain GMp14c1" /LENGTH=306 /DNA_ID=CAMNT_0048161391 /DNA_START=11 /DNA_END=931 /DNA_ORIENTATION=+
MNQYNIPTSTSKTPPPTTPIAKTIYIIRHGLARHNVPDYQTGERPNLLDPKYTDPSLIRQGELQARVLGEHLRRRGLLVASAGGIDSNISGSNESSNHLRPPLRPIELVVCSPLTRCLQTASHIFPSYFNESVEGVTSSSEQQSIFSRKKGHCGNKIHVLNGDNRVCCHGDVREAYGMHYPDKRSPLSQLGSKFPTVAYHPSLTEHDIDWKYDTRETRHDVSRRVRNFFVWLLEQPHDNVAIVTHGVWMECALLDYCPEVLEFGRKRVYNCEVYCGTLALSGPWLDGSGGGGVELNNVHQMSLYHA